MSKDLIVLAPNGRRQKLHCNPDTSILQILENVCEKQGFLANSYNLKHHNKILDLTNTIRFSNLPNKALLEMVEAENQRQETSVTIGLLLEDGERKTGDFSPKTTLYELITNLASPEYSTMEYPSILYMRQEVSGKVALKEKTLRQLGLIGGRAVLRLLNKPPEIEQANVSTVYRIPLQEKQDKGLSVQPAQLEKESSNKQQPIANIPNETDTVTPNSSDFKMNVYKPNKDNEKKEEAMEIDNIENKETSSSMSLATQEQLERRLKIEEEVIFLGSQKAIAFMQPDKSEEFTDLPDDFYDLTIDEVRKLYNDLQKRRIELENTPLVIASQQTKDQQKSNMPNEYKNAVVRIQFPDNIILQGVFSPSNKVEDITSFVKEHLENPEKEFHMFTTPLKEALDPSQTLLEARFVPCVHMHFKWIGADDGQPCLKPEIYNMKTSSDAASILASKYRAPTRRKIDGPSTSKKSAGSSSSKVPKWFK